MQMSELVQKADRFGSFAFMMQRGTVRANKENTKTTS